jgi:hypothetical protein
MPGAAVTQPRTCQACGEPGQPCCPINRCANNGCCVRRSPGDGGTCVAPGAACPGAGACEAGGCGTCGKPGQPCCGGGCTAPNTTCRLVGGHGERCFACGTRGEPCCSDALPAGSIAGQSTTCLGPNLSCRHGFCVES